MCRKRGMSVPRCPAPDPAASTQGTEPIMMTRCTREERKGGRGTVSAPPSPPCETFHGAPPNPQPHMQASCLLGQGRQASSLGLAVPSEGELTLLVVEQGFLALPNTCVSGGPPVLTARHPTCLVPPVALWAPASPSVPPAGPPCPLSLVTLHDFLPVLVPILCSVRHIKKKT